MSRWFVAAALALAIVVPACGKPASTGPAPRDRNVLTYEEIVTSAHAGSDLFEAVQSLRPHFLEPPPGIAPGSVSHTGTVYIDSRRAGGLEALHSLTAATVEEVRYLGPTQSQNEYGPRATLFTLVVRLRRARPDTTFGIPSDGR